MNCTLYFALWPCCPVFPPPPLSPPPPPPPPPGKCNSPKEGGRVGKLTEVRSQDVPKPGMARVGVGVGSHTYLFKVESQLSETDSDRKLSLPPLRAWPNSQRLVAEAGSSTPVSAPGTGWERRGPRLAAQDRTDSSHANEGLECVESLAHPNASE